MWRLLATNTEDANRLSFRLLPGHIRTMGRAPRADFIVDAPLVSRLHCRLTVSDDGTVHVKDLGSTNGTLIDGEQVADGVLHDGHLLGVGRVEFRLERQ
jgi:pSer/pThr/pTyr-binding forkhead associated (FHA) protein